ncbi:MAG: hypoxanthine phosphoribosyltransferase [Bacteroidetes bacterium]|nr:hypoxanthine phosphoribosyltransferase [Bacteroidota bacterium]
MNKIKVKDKEFEIFIQSEVILKAVDKVAQQINRDYAAKNPLFIVVLNGAFMFASDLFKGLNINCEISFVKLSSYSGTSSTESVKHLIGINQDIKGRDIILVEDIVDTGITIEYMIKELKKYEVADIKIASLLLKPDKYDKEYTIDYVAIEIPNDFIVGYGLDYDGFARNLPDIYKIV